MMKSIWKASLAVMLVACTDRPTVTDTAEAVPHPQVASTAQPHAIEVPWLATPDSLGPIAVGSIYSVLAKEYNEPPSTTPRDAEEEACDYAGLPILPDGVSLMLFGDTVVRIEVDTTGIRTRADVGVGSAEQEVLAKYAGHVRVAPHPYDGPEWHYVIVTPAPDSVYRMIFETDGKTVRSFRVGRRHAVDLIEGCS